VQPQGPYYLGGLSFGGVVAFEMAQQLRARGHLVALLALFDAGCPNYTRSWPASRRIRRHVENVLALDPRGKLDYVLGRVGSLKDIVAGRVHLVVNGYDPDVGRPLPRALLDARVASRIAMDRYMPHAYPGRVVLFLARHNPQSSYRHDPRLAWRKLATGKWEVEDVPGSHVGMLTEPHVRVLAEKLQACLPRAQTDAPGEQASAHAVAP
ncbi:MAG TPA: thioesterase domain-containing protein, partial [Dehalococcoidia bacterium]|nr:thioesterase domain-containing protein [Dehalococcoidia bacterium]